MSCRQRAAQVRAELGLASAALPLAVPAATVHMAAMRGMDVVVLRPEGFALPKAIMDKARSAAAQSGGSRARDRRPRRGARRRARGVRKEWGSTRHYGDEAADQARARSLKRLVPAQRLVRRARTTAA
jgi:ornithine carbamoyltransferase